MAGIHINLFTAAVFTILPDSPCRYRRLLASICYQQNMFLKFSFNFLLHAKFTNAVQMRSLFYGKHIYIHLETVSAPV